MSVSSHHKDPVDLVVVGAGPGGYTAAFRAADLGLETVLVERDAELGGVCLKVGCIPSKALLHVADVITQAAALEDQGAAFGQPVLEAASLRRYKDRAVKTLTSGLQSLAKRRGVRVIRGTARFADEHQLTVSGPEGEELLSFSQAILSVGSRPRALPPLALEHPRVMGSTAALDLPALGGSLLVVGGGVIGLELATVYRSLGSTVTVVELTDRLLPDVDPDLVKILRQHLEGSGVTFRLSTRVAEASADDSGVTVTFEGDGAADSERFDRVLVAVGRVPNGDRLDAHRAGVEVDEQGFLPVDDQLRTSAPHIFAVGDVARPPLLAHKAFYEARVAAEVAAGLERYHDARVIPAVAYTDPEIAWVGLTEAAAEAAGRSVDTARFPWSANGRALGMDRREGVTKLVLEPSTGRVLGAGIVGPNASELVGELALAIELGAVAEDLALTIHPHPTLSETIPRAAEMATGTSTDLMSPKNRKHVPRRG